VHIVFIVGSYHPNYSAVGRCVGNVADVLGKTHKITVICEKSCSSQIDKEIYNNQKILRVITEDKLKREILQNNKQNAKGISKKFASLRLNLHKFIQAAKIVFSNVSIKKELVDLYVARLLSINEKIDVIIPASMPFESVVAAYQYKKNFDSGVMMIPYLFDQFTNSQTLHRLVINKILKRKKHIEFENKILVNSNFILAMHSLKKYYTKELPQISNIIYVEHPLVKQIDNYVHTFSDTINISYIGGFYKNYVEPEYLLKLFKNTKINAKLNLYIIGNCNDVINKFINKYPNKIINHGSVDKNMTNKKLKESDILINVAEKKGIQMSSKIFEYISHGKPIVHFYIFDHDVNLKILKNYPLSLCLKQNQSTLEYNIKKFEWFCTENRNKKVSSEEVLKLFPDAIPEYTADLIEKLVLK